MFKVGDAVRDNGRGYPSQNMGKVGVIVRIGTFLEVLFPARSTLFYYRESELELVQKQIKPKGISAFIKKWEEEYSNAKTA